VSIALGLIGVVLLILANAFFVVAEFAYVAVDRTQVAIAAQTGSRPARLAASILRRMNYHLSGAQLGITFTSLALGVLAEPVVAPLIEPIFGTFLSESGAIAWSVVLALLLTTVAQMVVGELIPKSVAVSRPLSTALRVAAPFRIFVAVFRPAIAACNGIANGILSLVGMETTEELSSTRSRQELRRLVQSSQERGTLLEHAAVLLDRAFRFRDKTAADAMTPRPDVRGLPEGATTADLLAASSTSGLSRFPVFGDTGEHDLDEVVGVVHVKDILGIPPERRTSTPLVDLIRPVLMVPESKPLDDLMEELQPESGQFAVVLDEYGSLAGIVTLEDLVEEIVGDISDEHDPVVPRTTSRRWAGAHMLSGRLHRDEVEEACGLDFPEGDYETLAGFVLDQLGSIPTVGMGLAYQGWQLEVAEMDGRRIALVRVVAPPPTPLAGAGPGPPERSGS